MNQLATTDIRQEYENVAKTLEKMDDKLRAILPPNITPQRFRQICMLAVQKNPELLACDRRTLFLACLQAGYQGLLPDGREGAIIPRKDRDSGDKHAHWMPMYQGIIKAIHNSGTVAAIDAQAVFDGERFEAHLGDEPRIVHIRTTSGKRGKIVAAYSIITLRNTVDGNASNVKMREVLTSEDLQRIRASSKKQDLWNQWEDQMARKSAIRRQAKFVPWSAEDKGDQRARAVIEHVDDDYEFDNDLVERRRNKALALKAAAEAAGLSHDDIKPLPDFLELTYQFEDGSTASTANPAEWRDSWLALIAKLMQEGLSDDLRAARDRNAEHIAFAKEHLVEFGAKVDYEIARALGEAGPPGDYQPPETGNDAAASRSLAASLPGGAAVQAIRTGEPIPPQQEARQQAPQPPPQQAAAAPAKAASGAQKRGNGELPPVPEDGLPLILANGQPKAMATPKGWIDGIQKVATHLALDGIAALTAWEQDLQLDFDSLRAAGFGAMVDTGLMWIQQAKERARAAAAANEGYDEDDQTDAPPFESAA